MLAVDWFDTLEFHLTDDAQLTLECHPATLPTGPENLVFKAAVALRERSRKTCGAAIRLVKRIPHEAGLGGGSSDAATTILALNDLWQLNLRDEELREVAASVGSDVALFLNVPGGWCTGRGEIVEPIVPQSPIHAVVVKPNFGLATRSVYAALKVPDEPKSDQPARDALGKGDVRQLAEALHNRLEEPALALEPRLKELKAAIQQEAPLACQLSGSGSALFALAADRNHALALAQALRRNDRLVRSVSHVAAVRSWPSS